MKVSFAKVRLETIRLPVFGKEFMKVLKDSFNRQFRYLRFSVTEKCNFRCNYCLPNGYQGKCKEAELDLNEIQNLFTGFKNLGFTKVRLTGGEPTLRADITEIVQIAKNLGFESIGLTTNGYRLQELLPPLKKAGLDHLNLSLDSLNKENFKKITGRDLGDRVLANIHQALALNFKNIKVNAVLLHEINSHEVEHFMAWLKELPLTVRFIELMPTKDNQEYFKRHHLRADVIMDHLRSKGWQATEKKADSGPAQELGHAEYCGKIGFITPFQNHFCETCNRLRVSSTGRLRLCLFGQGDSSLRDLLQDHSQAAALIQKIEALVIGKNISHHLQQGDLGDTSSLSTYGG
jgi:cyclic pyranopterin phosphate synthase